MSLKTLDTTASHSTWMKGKLNKITYYFRMQVEMALNELRSQINADELLFWGKVTGINADYLIALAVTFTGMYEFP